MVGDPGVPGPALSGPLGGYWVSHYPEHPEYRIDPEDVIFHSSKPTTGLGGGLVVDAAHWLVIAKALVYAYLAPGGRKKKASPPDELCCEPFWCNRLQILLVATMPPPPLPISAAPAVAKRGLCAGPTIFQDTASQARVLEEEPPWSSRGPAQRNAPPPLIDVDRTTVPQVEPSLAQNKKGVPCHRANVAMAPIYEMTAISLDPPMMLVNSCEFCNRDGKPGACDGRGVIFSANADQSRHQTPGDTIFRVSVHDTVGVRPNLPFGADYASQVSVAKRISLGAGGRPKDF
ncbi:uncharacterized protein MKK02DRAFT_41908 [Dioszegia hungarica]|uniref:Uncharacterized protein n=1 Tax=Dioszegia hungarica TaxID=4972 RepID=A0AA38LYE5_9TREE|nr:uncharacterized protein MKK02DRAFT_41908 [Dioszegia hungarica]KAI9638881.1 hypothetical protein MKK02DRAFT_41908 [Dioszegia hungarica]